MNEQTPLYKTMKEAVSQTLENMAFIEATEHYDQDYEIPGDDLTWAYLVVQDPVPGEIRLALSQSMLKNLTSSVFSLETEEITEAQMKDILHELLNTIAGLFMTKLLADNQAYKIGLPEQGEGEMATAEPDTLIWKLMTSEEDPLQVQIAGSMLINYKS